MRAGLRRRGQAVDMCLNQIALKGENQQREQGQKP
jgi:hypothetical protein